MKCVFCKCDSEDSKSVEHVIPESLGSKTIVLPRGLVCDKCNNYFSHKVEIPILSHPSFKNIMAWYQVPSKKGRIPSVMGILAGSDINIAMKLDANGKLDVQPERERDRNILNKQLIKIGNGEHFNPFIFKIDIDPPTKEMSRFLAKMGLEFLVYRYMNDKDMIELIINSTHYDLIRNYARKGNNFKDWPYSMRRIYPIDTKMVHPKTGKLVMAGIGYDLLLNQRKEIYFVFLFYGVEFVINLGGPSIDGYKEWLELNKNISPIIERYGNQVTKNIINGEDSYIIQGDYNINNGILFDKKQLNKYISNSRNNDRE